MITNSQIKQFSTSWGLDSDLIAEQDFQIMQAQGQSFFTGSGDGDAYIVTSFFYPADDTNVTSCGGTTLVMSNSGAAYESESVWNSGNFGTSNGWCCNPNKVANTYWGSGGGVSPSNTIPIWQQSLNAGAVGGSSTYRNVPDVALTANNVWCYYFNGSPNSVVGTSCAAPLWAGFTALINEQAANDGVPSVGFLNPAIYAIGQSANYTNVFHDITTGSNTWPGSPNLYYAAPGYDLCTGWGSPRGQSTINALEGYGGQIWVNFSGVCPGNGTFTNPFCTLASGISAVASKGSINLVGPNSTSYTTTISKPMTLHAFYGNVKIGNN